ncbi:MAG: hypothetical protein ACE3L7_13725 [Candidatus Pristimantibacillus sp.]
MKRQEMLYRADVLKQYEVYGYQVAYYLLEDEALAIQAANLALVELFKDEEFFRQSQLLQKQKTKQMFTRQSLKIKSSVLQPKPVDRLA